MLRMVLVSAFALLFLVGSTSCVVVPRDGPTSRRRYVKVKKSKRVRCRRGEYFDGRRCVRKGHRKYKKHKKHKKHKKPRRRGW